MSARIRLSCLILRLSCLFHSHKRSHKVASDLSIDEPDEHLDRKFAKTLPPCIGWPFDPTAFRNLGPLLPSPGRFMEEILNQIPCLGRIVLKQDSLFIAAKLGQCVMLAFACQNDMGYRFRYEVLRYLLHLTHSPRFIQIRQRNTGAVTRTA